MLDALLDARLRATRSCRNSDNLGAVLDPRILAWFAARGDPVPDGGRRPHRGRPQGRAPRPPRATAGSSSCARSPRRRTRTRRPSRTSSATASSTRTTSGSTCARCARRCAERDGVLGLPMIVNRKTVDPGDPASPRRSSSSRRRWARRSASFEGARALRVPRGRFAPVKTTDDLLGAALGRLRARPTTRASRSRRSATAARRSSTLDSAHFKLLRRLRGALPRRAAVARRGASASWSTATSRSARGVVVPRRASRSTTTATGGWRSRTARSSGASETRRLPRP